MARDYAPNKRASTKRNATKRTKKKPSTKRSWIRILLTLLSTAGLVAVFVHLSQQPVDEAAKTTAAKNNTDQQATPAATSPKPKPKLVDPTTTPTPAKPKPKKPLGQAHDFTFYDTLPEAEIKAPKVDAYQSNPKDPTKNIAQRIQTGSFRNQKDAQSQRAQLILIGMNNVTIEQTNTTENGVWYRVRIGPFQSRSQLNKAMDVLAHNNFDYLRIN